MRRTIASPTASGRWRRRRIARIAVAAALIVAAPFAGHASSENSYIVDQAASSAGRPGSPTDADTPPNSGAPGSLTATMGGAGPDSAATGGSGAEAIRVVPVPLADPSVADALEAGDMVDLLTLTGTTPGAALPPEDPTAPAGPVIVARAALVRAVPEGRSGGRSILVEVGESIAPHLAATAATSPLAVVVHG